MRSSKTPFNKSRNFFDCGPKCEKRKPGCHDHCESYLKKRAELTQIREAEKQRVEIDQYTIEQCVKSKARNTYKRSAYRPQDDRY